MGATTHARPHRARRTAAAIMAALAMLLAAGGVVYGPAEPAAAVAVTIDNPQEIIPITQSVWPFDGQANPFETVTVQILNAAGTGCTDTADAAGFWACNVTFEETQEFTLVQAISFDHATPDQDEDTQEYAVSLPPSITTTPQTPGVLVSNVSAQPEFTGIADPGAHVEGTIGGQNCDDFADGTGAYTCQIAGGLGADFDYPITVRQTPVWGVAPDHTSADELAIYRLDTVGPGIPDFSYPYDTIGPGANEFTTDTTPPLGGNPGTGDPFGTVTVWGYQFSAVGVAPAWPVPPPDPGVFYCDAQVAVDGRWECSGAALPVGSVWVFGATQEDLAGNGTGSPDAEFSLQIVPPPAAPVVHAPVPGYTSLSPRVHVSTTNIAEATMYVREGGTDLCPPTPVPVPSFSCDTAALSPGVHVLSIFQEDKYGTFSPTVQRTVTILAPPVPAVLKTLTFEFRVLGPDGEDVDEDGLVPGDHVTIVAEHLPPGTTISAEIHSTPQSLGSTTIGDDGALALAATIPADVEIGDHDIVVAAAAPGYEPATFSAPVAVHEPPVVPDVLPGREQGGEHAHHGAGTAGQSTGNGIEDPSTFGTALESPFRDQAFRLSAAGLVLSGSIAVAFLLLVGFPAELLESTIRSNYDRAFGWLARLRRRAGRMLSPVVRALSHPVIGTGITVLAAAILLGFADPGFGFTGASLRLLLAMIVSVVAINIGLSLIVMRVARRAFDVRAMLQPMPAALAIVALSVLVSRLAGISPGFLFGVVLGVAYARELRLRDDARLGLLGVGLTIVAGLLAWLGYGVATAVMSGQGFLNNLLIETLAAITLEALGTLVVALLPIEFLDGRTIFRWSRLAWAGAYLVTVSVFLFVVVPLSDNWGTMSAPILGWGTLFAVFAVVAIATWAIFRRRAGISSSTPADAEPPRRQRR